MRTYNIASLLIVFQISLFISCQDSVDKLYIESIEEWRDNRIKELTAPDGWTSVVGLFWLKEGHQFFGSSTHANEMIWPEGIPSTIGRFDLEGDSVVMVTYKNLHVLVDNEKKTRTRMVPDTEGNPTIANRKQFFWHLIKRQDKYGIRLKDTLNPARFELKEIPHYPVRPSWKKVAQFIPAEKGQRVKYKNTVGMQFDQDIEGVLRFEHKGDAYELIVLLDKVKDTYFVIFADKTTNNETYGGGRYLYPQIADENGLVVLDFNKAINPPCVFTNYATCPFPPEENHLPFKVKAGEKMFNFIHE